MKPEGNKKIQTIARERIGTILQDAVTIPRESVKIHKDYHFNAIIKNHNDGDVLTQLPVGVTSDILALDASYRFTGFALIKDKDMYTGIMSPFTMSVVNKKTGTQDLTCTGHPRLSEVIEYYYLTTLELLKQVKPTAVIIEDVTKQTADPEKVPSARAGIYLAIRQYGQASVCKMPPTKLKKLATGNGLASKDDMVATVERLYGEQMYTSPLRHDQCDALLLGMLARNHAMFMGVNFTNAY